MTVKLFEPNPSIEMRRVISRAGLAACKELSLLIKRGRLIFEIGDFVDINNADTSGDFNESCLSIVFLCSWSSCLSIVFLCSWSSCLSIVFLYS